MSSPSLKALAAVFKKHNVSYVVVGGYALLMQGGDLTTYDIDLCIAYDSENLDSLANALNEVGARTRSGELSRLDRFSFGGAFNTFFTEVGVVQILNRVSGYESFAELEAQSVTLTIQTTSVRVAKLAALKAMKLGTGRGKDKIHLSLIERLEALSTLEE
ncbi:MAG: hypothetical protein WCK51_10870 [Armatimonadota bacterium]